MKCLSIHGSISYENSKDEIERYLKVELGKIVPLFPEEEASLNIRYHNENKRSLIDHERVMLLLLVVIVFVTLLYRLL
jgi:hypothetical protein